MSDLPVKYCIDAAAVEAAAARIHGIVHETPVMTCSKLNCLASNGAADGVFRTAFFKCENFQRSGSFKYRGASNAVMSLDEKDAAKGVCTHSSGNHAQALALAASCRGIPAYIVMPRNAPASKKAAVAEYGGTIIECEPTQAAREAEAARVATETGACFVHPSEDVRVIAGQGSLAVELLRQVADITGDHVSPLDTIIVPIGGGGMTSGIATYVKAKYPHVKIIAAEPLAASDAFDSKTAGKLLEHSTPPDTIADGLKTTLGPNTWPIVRDLVDSIICVTESEIIEALRLVFERMKLVIEPSSAVGVAALLSKQFKALEGVNRVGVILCGGNTDVAKLPF